MARSKDNLIVGLTTFNHEFLKISVSGLGRVGKNVTLIIYNDNPCRKLTHRALRRMGFHGRVHVINGNENLGQFGARMSIIEYVQKNNLDSPWFMFANDDDIVLNTSVPNIDENNYAVMGNAVVIAKRVLDVLRVMDNPNDYTIDGADTHLIAPHIAMSGTFIRMAYLREFVEFMSKITSQISDIILELPFAVPVDLFMWHMFVEYMRVTHPQMSPIYMNQTNYLMTKLNNTRHPTPDQCNGIVGRTVSIVSAALRGNE